MNKKICIITSAIKTKWEDCDRCRQSTQDKCNYLNNKVNKTESSNRVVTIDPRD